MDIHTHICTMKSVTWVYAVSVTLRISTSQSVLVSQSLRFIIMDLIILTLLHSYIKSCFCNLSAYLTHFFLSSVVTLSIASLKSHLTFADLTVLLLLVMSLFTSAQVNSVRLCWQCCDVKCTIWFCYTLTISVHKLCSAFWKLENAYTILWFWLDIVLFKSVINFRLLASLWKAV